MNSICMCVQKERMVLSLFPFSIQSMLLQSKKMVMAVLLGYQGVWIFIMVVQIASGSKRCGDTIGSSGGIVDIGTNVWEGGTQVTIFTRPSQWKKVRSVCYFLSPSLNYEIKDCFRLVFLFNWLLEWRMKVCRVYSNRFRKLDMVFRNVMKKLSRKLKLKPKVYIRLWTFWKLLLNLRNALFFLRPKKNM